MNEKPNVRKAIGTGIVSNWSGDHIVLNIEKISRNCGVTTGDRVEIVAVFDAPKPKRKLVRPVGAVWIFLPALGDTLEKVLLVNNLACARACQGYYIFNEQRIDVEGDGCLKLSMQAAEEARADAGSYGFRWKEVKPEYVQWCVIWNDGIVVCGGDKGQHGHIYFGEDGARREFLIQKDRGSKCKMWGIDEKLNWYELDRYDAEDDD